MTEFDLETGPMVAEHYFAEIHRLYCDTFSAPPFVWSAESRAEHHALLTRLMSDPTFSIVVARQEGATVGFGYGHRLPVDHGWWHDFPSELPGEVTAEWPGRTFALIDWAVDQKWRGRGIGGAVLSRLLSDRRERRAVLSVQPTAVRTQRIYRHLGWVHVGRKGPLAGVRPPYWDIYTRELHS